MRRRIEDQNEGRTTGVVYTGSHSTGGSLNWGSVRNHPGLDILVRGRKESSMYTSNCVLNGKSKSEKKRRFYVTF